MEDDIPDLVDLRAEDGLPSETTLAMKKVPITIVTGVCIRHRFNRVFNADIRLMQGYLGAGKTTLLNYILTAEHGKKIAVILNGRSHTLQPRLLLLTWNVLAP